MGFMDDLALVEVLIGFVAVLLAYVGVLSWWAIRTNNPKFLKETLRSSAIPVGGVGITTMILALWTEMTWPYTLTIAGTNVIGGYNIFFGDAMVLFGLVAICYAVVAYFGRNLHVVGLLSLVAGFVLAFYGWTGYTANPAFTKDPYDTFLMYGAFAAAGLAAFPATVITDYYLNAVAASKSIWQSAVSYASPRRIGTAARAAQPVSTLEEGAKDVEVSATETRFRVHWALQIVMLAFPVLMTCAAIAAFWYFAITLPGHLGNGAAGAP